MILEAENQLIGRESELSWLKAAWMQAARQGRPQVCVLRGESGFGKTRIVQAFYSWLSTDREQDPQGYWPDILLKEGNNLCLNPPPSNFNGVKALPWLWWGVRWSDPGLSNRGELSSCALIDGLHHFEPHREALLARSHKLKRAGKAAAELGAVVAELSSFGIVGAGKSLYELFELWGEERRMQGQEQLSVEERQASALQAQIDGLYEFLCSQLKLSVGNRGGLPLILVLDDAHWIDARSLKLIDRLLVGGGGCDRWPLMIIVTHWEQDWNLQAQDVMHSTFPALYASFKTDPPRGGTSLSMELRDIGRLDGLDQLIHEGLPGLTEEQVEFLCARADGNPRLMNEIILELRDEPSYFEREDTGQPLSEEGLVALRRKSFALHEVQKRRFRRLDEALRKILSYASYQGMRFLRQLVLDVAQVADAAPPSDTDADRLSHAVQPYAVLAAESAAIYEFRHRVFHDLARERIDRLPQLDRSLSKAMLQVAGEWLRGDRLASLLEAEREVFYLLMLEQLEQTDGSHPNLRLQLIAGLLALYLRTGYFAKARSWSDRLADELPADGHIAGDILSPHDQLAIIYLFLELDRRGSSETLARGLVETCRIALEESDISAERLGYLSAAEDGLGDVLLRADQPEPARTLFEKALATRERLISEFGETAERLRDVTVSQVKIGDVLLRADQPEPARALYEKALATRERLISEFGETAERLRDVTVSQVKIGDLLQRADQPEPARAIFEKSLATCERIISEFGETVGRLRDVSVAQDMVGEVLLRADQSEPARALFEKALATHERIINEFGETAQRLRDMSVAQMKIGDVLLRADQSEPARTLFEKALATHERIISEFGETAGRLRDVSVAQKKVGEVLLRADQPEPARALFEKALATHERIINAFGETAERLRDVSLSQEKVGDVLLCADQSEPARALYEKSLATCERIISEFGETSERLRDVTASQMRIGDVLLRANQSEPARALYDKSLATCERLISEFGETAERLRDVTVSQVKIGDLLLSADQSEPARALFEKALATHERLISEFGETAERLRDVSLSQDRVGDVLLRADQPEPARALYEKALATRERLISEFGETAERLRDVSLSQDRVGNVLLRADQPEPARALYEKALATRERLISEFGETAERLRDVTVSQVKIGDVLLRADQPEPARALFEKSLATCERIISEFGETAERLRDVAISLFKLGISAQDARGIVLARKQLAASEALFASVAASLRTTAAQSELDSVRALIAEIDKADTATMYPANQSMKVVREKVGRNDPCPCGSGKRFKLCHGMLV